MTKNKCPDCNSKLEISYHVFDWDDESTDDFIKSFDEAKQKYDKMVKENPGSNWRLLKDSYCPCCEEFIYEDEYLLAQ